MNLKLLHVKKIHASNVQDRVNNVHAKLTVT